MHKVIVKVFFYDTKVIYLLIYVNWFILLCRYKNCKLFWHLILSFQKDFSHQKYEDWQKVFHVKWQKNAFINKYVVIFPLFAMIEEIFSTVLPMILCKNCLMVKYHTQWLAHLLAMTADPKLLAGFMLEPVKGIWKK